LNFGLSFSMARFIRWTGIALGALVLIVALAAGVVYAASERKLDRIYSAHLDTVPVPTDSASIARGAHLASSVTTCALCHAADGGGAIYADMGAMGRIVGPNLTRGRGGRGDSLSDADWVRAVRYGIRSDSTSLIVMPSEVFSHLSDEDLGAIIAYYRSLPAVDRELPDTRFGPIGRALLAAGKLNILVAPKTPRLTKRVAVAPAPTADYGRYLADVAGCHGCHGYGLSGGRVAGPPGLPPASNLTPAGIGDWTPADFTRAMREGLRRDGSTLDEFMPWKIFRGMTDVELTALWRYLRSVPAKEFGNK
jgi:cytochrome c553